MKRLAPQFRLAPANRSPRQRGGWSILEIVITVGVSLILITIAVAVLLSRREFERTANCQEKLRWLGQKYSTDPGGRLPWLVDGQSNWVMHGVAGLTKGPPEPDQHFSELLCPADPARMAQRGGLSYVANGGFGLFTANAEGIHEQGKHSIDQDLNGDGKVSATERDIARSTGLFWRQYTKVGPSKMTLRYVAESDGLDATFMLSENTNARQWASHETADLAFVIGRGQLKFGADPLGPQALLVEPFDLGQFRPNASVGTLGGKSPVPSSWHQGAVNMLFCSGRGQSLSAQIDPQVYERMLTPAGSRYGEPAP